MFAIVPLLCFGFIVLSCRSRSDGHKALSDWRATFLLAATGWALLVVTITEVLSGFDLLVFGWVLACWGVALALAAGFGTSLFVKCVAATGRPGLMPLVREPVQALMSIGVAVIVAIVGLTAWAAPPNTWDAMTYHMSRVMHWLQNHNTGHYPSGIVRQLYLPPWAEYAILQFQVLSGGDRLANLVQWFSQVGSLLGVSLLAKQFGAGTRGQVVAAVICATIPMGIVQASGAKNDYVAAFWLVCFVYFLLQYRDTRAWVPLCAAGSSLGLAWLTKSTTYLYTFPFLVWFGVWGFRRMRWRLWRPALLLLLLPLLVNVAHYHRNLQLFGSPLGPDREPLAGDTDPIVQEAAAAGIDRAEIRYRNDTLTVPMALSNVVRNIALHMGTPSPKVNHAIEAGIRELHRRLGVDIVDPRSTWPGTQFRVLEEPSHSESTAANPLHLLLIATAIVCYLARWRSGRSRDAAWCAVALTAAFLLFCVFLRWQPWHSRLQLPLFVLWSPVIASALSPIFAGRLVKGIAVGLFLAVYPWLFSNGVRPLVGARSVLVGKRVDQYFETRPGAEKWFRGAALYIEGRRCAQVGLLVGWWNEWEYPWWVLLQRNSPPLSRLEHVQVRNVSEVLAGREPFSRFDPCAIIVTEYAPRRRDGLITPSGAYVETWRSGPVRVFEKSQ